MRGIYVHCREHGIVESTVVGHSGGMVVMSNANAECPICGRMSPVVDGSYHENSAGELSTVLLPTPEQARALQAMFREIDRIAQSRKFSPAEAATEIADRIAKIADTSPAIAEEFTKRTAGQPRKAWSVTAKAITAALAIVGAYNTVSDFSEKVSELVSYFMAH